ncbi:MAG: type II toxin-antitoxin system RelE/ParE family toxin [Endomicrobium sp.]|jgi:putative addiction module killer protein|nr:type II toxin-antitoxin system RelE/ParE family toxin [Endomicrobium sp.]
MISKQTPIFRKWLEDLDYILAVVIFHNIEKLEKGNFSNCKPVGNGVHEQKIDFQKGYRLYFTNINDNIIVLLVVGNKSTQDKDIRKAKELKEILTES